jgi:hypothetical protein
MLFAGYVDITRRQSFGCHVLTKISQKIDNLIARLSRDENIGEDGKDVLEVAWGAIKIGGVGVLFSTPASSWGQMRGR